MRQHRGAIAALPTRKHPAQQLHPQPQRLVRRPALALEWRQRQSSCSAACTRSQHWGHGWAPSTRRWQSQQAQLNAQLNAQQPRRPMPAIAPRPADAPGDRRLQSNWRHSLRYHRSPVQSGGELAGRTKTATRNRAQADRSNFEKKHVALKP